MTPDRDLALMQALWGVDHALQTMSKQMESVLGVTGPQRLVIRVVGQKPDVSAGEIAEWLSLHPSTVTGILQRLESRGRIERRRDPDDARRSLFRLTDEGRKIHLLRSGTVESVVHRVVADSEAASIDATIALLLRLARELDECAAAKGDP